MDINEQITRFQTMAEADPNNELGHYSLGKALLEANRPEEAADSLERVLQLNGRYSKAYELLAAAQVRMSQEAAAIGTLKKGYVVAAERGDVMPKEAMAKTLLELGQQLPEVDTAVAGDSDTSGSTSGDGTFQCRRCGQAESRMEEAPFKGDLGAQVYAKICTRCWQEWVGMGTKVINELGLPLADPKAQEMYDQHMSEFLQL
ncbi:MAG: Fe(2+)-trafficking protein [Planctomycetes bacterium]|nr:Fe(2+)-trafficking protein [Planctomycetota bacterium]